MKPKHETINEILSWMNVYQPYLKYGEIGTAYGDNYVRIFGAHERHGCEVNVDRYFSHEYMHGPLKGNDSLDYMTSYDWIREQLRLKRTFDLIFIDGDHRRGQVRMDIEGAWTLLRQGGIILLHDVHPKTPRQGSRTQPKGNQAWCGDLWRTFTGYRYYNPDYPSGTLQEKWGLGWIQKVTPEIPEWEDLEWPWEHFAENYLEMLGYANGISALQKALKNNYERDPKHYNR